VLVRMVVSREQLGPRSRRGSAPICAQSKMGRLGPSAFDPCTKASAQTAAPSGIRVGAATSKLAESSWNRSRTQARLVTGVSRHPAQTCSPSLLTSMRVDIEVEHQLATACGTSPIPHAVEVNPYSNGTRLGYTCGVWPIMDLESIHGNDANGANLSRWRLARIVRSSDPAPIGQKGVIGSRRSEIAPHSFLDSRIGRTRICAGARSCCQRDNCEEARPRNHR
jgi:hypothetical protein